MTINKNNNYNKNRSNNSLDQITDTAKQDQTNTQETSRPLTPCQQDFYNNLILQYL